MNNVSELENALQQEWNAVPQEHYSQIYRVIEKTLLGLCCCIWWSYALLTFHFNLSFFSFFFFFFLFVLGCFGGVFLIVFFVLFWLSLSIIHLLLFTILTFFSKSKYFLVVFFSIYVCTHVHTHARARERGVAPWLEHSIMMRWVVGSILNGGPIELHHVPASAPRLV